jgi:hypothetical protein
MYRFQGWIMILKFRNCTSIGILGVVAALTFNTGSARAQVVPGQALSPH